MKFLLATILSVPGAAATTGYVGPFTSFAGDKKCTSVPTDSSFHTEGAGATNYALNYNCECTRRSRSTTHVATARCTPIITTQQTIRRSMPTHHLAGTTAEVGLTTRLD